MFLLKRQNDFGHFGSINAWWESFRKCFISFLHYRWMELSNAGIFIEVLKTWKLKNRWIKFHNKKDIIIGLYQEYYEQSPMCWGHFMDNLAYNSSLWQFSIPHPMDSGKCFTYKCVDFINLPTLIISLIYFIWILI